MKYYHDKVVIVTGAASGIGRALCEALVTYQLKVLIMVDLRQEGLDSLVGVFKGRGYHVEARAVDVSQEEEIKALYELVIDRYGCIDIVFNNAGISLSGLFQHFSIADWERYIAVNLWGVIFGTKYAYDQMLQQKHGHIVNTASLGGIIPQPLSIPYAVSKHGVVGLSTSLANEARMFGINVSVVCPGFVKTSIFEDLYCVDEFDKEKLKALLNKTKNISAEKCAKVILKKVSRKKVIITTDMLGRMLWLFYRLFPALMTGSPKKMFERYVQAVIK